MCFLVVATSQIGSVSCSEASSVLSGEALRRFLVLEVASLRSALVLMCLRRALEALRT